MHGILYITSTPIVGATHASPMRNRNVNMAIREYIINNPAQWGLDQENT
ncbi:MAG: hypothetical protein ACNA7Y_00660 [Gammaproteobacteria bacterium]